MRKLIETRGLKKIYKLRKGLFSPRVEICAIDGVDLEIQEGETLGLVGESGCGKSTLGRVIIRLEDPTEGKVFFDGQDLTALPPVELKPFRRKMQIVFQDPYNSLNPRKKVLDILSEPFLIHGILKGRRERLEKVRELLQKVGLPEDSLYRYPHEFSGGQRQRIVIARAIALNPAFIVADEPLSALDVSVQAQILRLFVELQESLNLTYLFISHDINVVGYIATRIAVMYLGKIVEMGPKEEVLKRPLHPYTEGLLRAVPSLEVGKRILPPFSGDPPSPTAKPRGCPFLPRCPRAWAPCRDANPPAKEVAPGHWVACFLYE
ncbi:MAG: peptide ABC transporter ATP-binding protein [Deltaproteobacteria bacterium]|nr:MAG: peptide ABC transporter ATP-binding protein [Deltaproteobacteria bacterium]